jgi:GGDEF domain-containing protein
VLSNFILLLRNKLPKNSISLRFRHGDEFLFFLPENINTANKLFSDFNSYCENYTFLKKPDGGNFIISFRFAPVMLEKSDIDFNKVLQIAEAKLREVKGHGSQRKI